jgi:hypothetical protein
MANRVPLLSTVAALCAPLLAVSVSAQTEQVDIYYDASMVPHVFGESDASAFYGLGYQHMRDNPIGTLDRLWRFTGRFSEVAGPSYLDEDYQIRLWELPTIAVSQRATLASDVLELLGAYVRGIEDARAWWRNGSSPPSTGTRLRRLLGTETDPDNVELNVDPPPDYLNQGFHPFQYFPDGNRNTVHPGYDPADVPAYIRRVIDRLFDTTDPTTAITIDHVLTHAIAFNSGPQRLFKAFERRGVPSATNAWLISPTAAGGNVTTLNDPHSVRDSLKSRPYFVQIHGDRYQVSGYTMPGLPVYVGYNDYLSWTLSGSASGAVTGSTWEVRLATAGPLRFRYGTTTASHKLAFLGGIEPTPDNPVRVPLERLQRVPDTLAYFDVVGSTDLDADGELDPGEVVIRSQARERFYVRDHGNLGLPNDRYPVTTAGGETLDGIFIVPQPGDLVVFEQASFTTTPSLWEFFIRAGRAHHIDNAPVGQDDVLSILGDVRWAWDNNFMFADYTGRFFYVFMATVPRLGPGAARFANADYRRISAGDLHLDGGLPADRWTGFFGLADLPQIGPTTVTGPEVWIANTITPDLIEVGPSGANPADDRLTADDLATVPLEIMRPRSVSSWRQVRAQELLQQQSLGAGALAGLTETVAIDKTDPWIRLMWPFVRRARDIKAAELVPADPDFAALAAVDRFLAWVEEQRDLSPDGLTHDAAYDFTAHPYSLVTPYTTLLRSWYQGLLDPALLTELQATFGEDAVHPLFQQGTVAFGRPDYDPNIEALWDALIGSGSVQPGVVPLWQAGTGGQGLQNHDFLVSTGAVSPWFTDPRFDDLQTSVDPNFAADIGGTRSLRWGHVNVLVMTPHFIAPGRSGQFNMNPDWFRVHLLAGLRPDLIAGVDPGGTDALVRRFKFPAYENQSVRAYPIGGTPDSLFVTTSQPIFSATSSGADQALYRWNPDDGFFFVPHEQGSQALLAVELQNPPGARGRFLESHGGTEITHTGFGAYQDRFAASDDFAAGVWRDLETDEGVLAGISVFQLPLTYTPAP